MFYSTKATPVSSTMHYGMTLLHSFATSLPAHNLGEKDDCPLVRTYVTNIIYSCCHFL